MFDEHDILHLTPCSCLEIKFTDIKHVLEAIDVLVSRL
jgi:hypothetical protein